MEDENFDIDQDLDIDIGEGSTELNIEMLDDHNMTGNWNRRLVWRLISEIDARKFYATYARAKGFGVAIRNSKKRNGARYWVQFGCHKGGLPQKSVDPLITHPTTKTYCKATINIARQIDEKWKLNSVHLEHNHPMDPEKSKYLRCYRKLPVHVQREIELNCGAGIKINQTVNSFNRRAGENHERTWSRKDARNHMDEVRRHELKEGDAQAMLQYFQRMQNDNNDFFYSIDVDENNCLRRVFWADARSREAYKEFGDAVTFDTTYLVNKYHMPFAPFVGVNHHGQSTLFGCGLVSSEDTDSFVWLFETWLACMLNVYPRAIVTDQDRAMQNAISIVFPHTRHRWCLWHIMKKVPEKFKNKEHIQSAISCVVYDSLTISDFEDIWAKMIKDYKMENNEWLCSMYNERNRWVPAFVKDTFWAGMSTTQRSESINAFFDGYVHSKTTLKEFANQYENALRKRVEDEEEEDARSFNSQYRTVSPYDFEKQFHDAYTITKFRDFRKELSDLIACELVVGPIINGIEHFLVEQDFEVGLTTKVKKTVKFMVHFNEVTGETNCICRLFESKGMVCVHMLRIYKWKKLPLVPQRYILHRWCKNIVRRHTKVRLSYTNWQKKIEWCRFDDLQALFNEAAGEAIFTESVTNKLKDMLTQFIADNKQQCATHMPFVVPASADVHTLESQVISVGDPRHGNKKGRPETKRKTSHYEKGAKKNATAKKKKQDGNASKKMVERKNTSMKKVQDSQRSANVVDLNEPFIDLGY